MVETQNLFTLKLDQEEIGKTYHYEKWPLQSQKSFQKDKHSKK